MTLLFSYSLVTGGQVSRVHPGAMGLNPAWRKSMAYAAFGIGRCHFGGDQRCSSTHHARYEDRRSHSPGIRRIHRRGRAPHARGYLSLLLLRFVVRPQASPYEFDWKKPFFGSHYNTLLAIKYRYDPNSMFLVHEGIGSDEWDRDPVCRLRPLGDTHPVQLALVT